jgi:hypothetical protein
MTDRITPLPWKVKGSINEAQTQVYMENESGWVCSAERMYGEKSKQEANAAYIVHACNILPEMIEALESAWGAVLVHSGPDSADDIKNLIQKAKELANG